MGETLRTLQGPCCLVTQSYSCLSSVVCYCGSHLWWLWAWTGSDQQKDSQHQIFLLHSGKGPPNFLLRHTQRIKRKSRPGRMVCDLSVTVFSCDWHPMGKVTPQLLCHAEASCGKAAVLPSISHTLMLLRLDNFWASQPGCINTVGMAKQSVWICFAAAVSTFNLAQTSWLSCLYWHLRDALVSVLILRELSGLETIVNGNSMHCASMKLLVRVRLAIPHLVCLLKSCMVFLNYFLTLVPRDEVIRSVNQDLFGKNLFFFLYALAYLYLFVPQTIR